MNDIERVNQFIEENDLFGEVDYLWVVSDLKDQIDIETNDGNYQTIKELAGVIAEMKDKGMEYVHCKLYDTVIPIDSIDTLFKEFGEELAGLGIEKPKDKYTILDYLKENDASEIEIYSDVYSDFAVSFVYDLNAIEMFGASDSDKVLHWMAENIEIVDRDDDYAICNISSFVEKNYDLFKQFCAEHNNDYYQMDRDNMEDNIEIGLSTVKSLIVGGYGDIAYGELAKEIENIKDAPSIEEER